MVIKNALDYKTKQLSKDVLQFNIYFLFSSSLRIVPCMELSDLKEKK